jgi:uncharacterized secreted protein with C-terminal beta-propeller domain
MELAKNLPGRLVFFSGGLENSLSADVKAAPAHSTTNIQVVGVDEADIVKTDDKGYVYVVSGNAIYILQAYPPEQAKVLSKIVLNETYGVEIYVNGDRLAILGSSFQYVFRYVPYFGEMFINVYDISNRSQPTLTRTVSLNGTLSGSRMIGNYIYAVITQPAIRPSETNETDFEVDLPKIVVDGSVKEVQPTEIRYVNVSDASYSFTTVIAVNIVDDAQEPTYEPVLTSATSCMYVSTGNMYLTVPNTNLWILSAETSQPQYETLIYRVKLNKEKIIWEAEGSVPGYVLNQFSMDEYNGFFRIATTSGWGENAVNNLFILDMSLNIVGNLTNLDPGKQIYAARFMGDRCYLVTFFQKDPFFVIDVSNPFEPKVLGALEIEGFSGYLHPYDENRVIGIGMEENKVKLSLYNVTDVADPKEIDKFLVPGDWSGTTVLGDHKAFLFEKEKQLLAIPVSISWVEIRDGKEGYSKGFWQGAYIFKISLEGFTLRGNVTHQDDATWVEGGFEVKRILYIENVLYTVSDRKVKLNSLEDLSFINEIKLS